MFGKSQNHPVKSLLKKELENTLQLKRGYEQELGKIPRGAIVSKEISGHTYYYLAFREGVKVKYKYFGKLSDEEVKKYKEQVALRRKYRTLLNDANGQIRFIKKTLK